MNSDMLYAMRSIGTLPTPVIDLAICTVAELLQPLDAQVNDSQRNKCTTRVRLASMAALEAMPLEAARIEYLWRYGLATGQEAAAARRLPRTDWLRQAKAALEAIGIDPGPDSKRMATRYGWNTHPGQRGERKPLMHRGAVWEWPPQGFDRRVEKVEANVRPVVSAEERLQAAEQLRARLSCMPFYARRAEQARQEHGDEMVYWLDLQSSQMTAHRR
jgi:hypothetical protein